MISENLDLDVADYILADLDFNIFKLQKEKL